MNKGIIYKVTCAGNNNFIIGSTLDFKRRKGDYLKDLRKNRWGNPYLQNCYNEYGHDSIIFEIIKDDIPENILLAIEDIYIGLKCARVEDRKGGMNMQNATRFNPSQEIKDKISESVKKHHANCGHPLLGKQHSDETKKKIREATVKQLKEKGHPFLGKHHSTETKEKIRQALLKRNKKIVEIFNKNEDKNISS